MKNEENDEDDEEGEDEFDYEGNLMASIAANLNDTTVSECNDYSDTTTTKKKKTAKARRCRNKNQAFSSFDSNVNNAEAVSALLLESEFEMKTSESYAVFVETSKSAAAKTTPRQRNTVVAYQLKYDQDLRLTRAQTMPIKWLSIDIRNTAKTHASNRDVRFTLLSNCSVLVENGDDENNNELNLMRLDSDVASKCLVQRDESDRQQLTVNEPYRSATVFVKHSKMVKYAGTLENWSSVLAKAGMSMSSLVNAWSQLSELERTLKQVVVSVCDSREYSQNDALSGRFHNTTERKEVLVSLEADINKYKVAECSQVVQLMWHIAQAFATILE